MKDYNKVVHLTNILNVIDRMGRNSFLLKGWSVGIMIAVYSFASDSSEKAIIVTLIPLLVIWVLDSYYLMIERKFRKLYDTERIKKNKDIDFNMNYNNVFVEMKDAEKYTLLRAFLSKTVLPFYLVCIITTIFIYLV